MSGRSKVLVGVIKRTKREAALQSYRNDPTLARRNSDARMRTYKNKTIEQLEIERKKQSETMSKIMKSPEVRENCRVASLKAWANKTVEQREKEREIHREASLKARCGKYEKTPEMRRNIQIASVRRWEDIQEHIKASESLLKAHRDDPTMASRQSASLVRYYVENPEIRAREKNPAWLGGKSFEPYTLGFNRQLKELIRMRDGYTCQICGLPENENLRALVCHHIDYEKTNVMPNNLISLCNACHAKTNINRQYWTKYFRDLLNQRQLNPKAFAKKDRKRINLLIGENYGKQRQKECEKDKGVWQECFEFESVTKGGEIK